MRTRSKKLCKRKDYQGNEYEYEYEYEYPRRGAGANGGRAVGETVV